MYLHDGMAEILGEMRFQPALELGAQDAGEREGANLGKLERRAGRDGKRIGKLRLAFDAHDDPVTRLEVAALEPTADQRRLSVGSTVALEPRQLVPQPLAGCQRRPGTGLLGPRHLRSRPQQA